MKHVISSVLACLTLALLLFTTSCSKKGDRQLVPGKAEANYWPDQRYCNIDSIVIPNSTRYYKFTYDAQGDPVSMVTNQPGTGNPNRYFFYDAQKRMSKHYGLYSDGVSFEQFTKFVYGSNNKVIRDTTYNFGTVSAGQPVGYMSWHVSHYSYDAAGRISQVELMWSGVPGSGFTKTYTYDASGNLIRPGITYDVKNNIHNTNNWWRLLDRDYSVNNPYIASSYTGYWLPRNIFSDGITNFRYFLNLELPEAKFRYACGD